MKRMYEELSMIILELGYDNCKTGKTLEESKIQLIKMMKNNR